MQLLSPRLRLLLIGAVWLLTLFAIILWLGGSRQKHLTIAGGLQGSETYALSQAIADAINHSRTGLQITVYESGGSGENSRLLEAGRVDLATIQADTPVTDRVAGVATLYRNAYHLLALDGAGIDSVADLPGHRVAIPPASSGEFKSFWFLVDHYRLPRDGMIALPMSEAAADFAMQRGQVDAVFRVRAPGNAAIRELIGERRMHLVPIPQAQAMALQEPAVEPGVIPLGSYRGHPALPEADLPTAIVDRLLVARSDLKPSVVHKLTRELYDHRAEIMDANRLAGFIGPVGEESDSVVAAHPGARAYYDREKPGYLQQNARLFSALLYVLVIVGSGLLALRTHWVRSRRMRMHTFNRQLMDIAAAVRREHGVEALLQRKHQLVDMLDEVVRDLEREKVSQEEFEHFSFTWQAVDALIRDRLHLGDALPAPQVEASS
ncbi:MAG: hypothetical protein CME59_15115 [Halioglobus sp.]|nr:hypothetical protein [Halioglobus sp.]